MNYPGGIDLVISILKIGELSLKTSQNLVGLMMEEGGDYKPRNPFGLWKPALTRIQRNRVSFSSRYSREEYKPAYN